MREWFETRLLLPFLPLLFDVLLRVLALQPALSWWQIPDIKTLSITTAFFCLLLAMDLKSASKLPGDSKHGEVVASLRKRFIVQGSISSLIFGGAATVDVADRYYNKTALSEVILPTLLIIVLSMLVFSIIDAIFANFRYGLSYNG